MGNRVLLLKLHDTLEELGIHADVALGFNEGGIQKSKITLNVEDFLHLLAI